MFKNIYLTLGIIFVSHSWAIASISPEKGLDMLIEGNNRFAAGKSTHKKWEQEARKKQSASHSPFAIILGCSDARSPAEIIFDQDLGDLFVVRVAGNVVGELELASIEFAVAHLHSAIIMVLGHQECGAVKTALTESKQLSELSAVYPLIASNIAECKQEEGDKLKKAICCNVQGSMRTLKASPVLSSFLGQKKLKIVGGYYDFNTGNVKIISESQPQVSQQH
jgi:carbonic anhydrase